MKSLSAIILAAALLSACSNAQSAEKPAPSTAAEIELTPQQKRGVKIFKRCRACHTLDEGGKNKVGPNLWDFYGSKAGAKSGYAYSKAMKAADVIWDKDTLDAYLQRPSRYMPGNKMSFIGLKEQEDRDAVQAYLKIKTTP